MSDQGVLVEALRWYVAAGVDEAIGDQPVSRYADAQPRPPLPPIAKAAPAADGAGPRARPVAVRSPPPATALSNAVISARNAAVAAESLSALRDAVAGFDECSLKSTATKTVFADGNPEAGLMLIGEAPGGDEDRIGLPFVGVSGKLLDRMLGCIGIDRTSCYITNVVFWRPPGNRKPTPGEIDICRPFVHRHIQLVAPRVIVIVGGTAASALMSSNEGITRLRGRWMTFEIPGQSSLIPIIATYHPSFLLRSPERKRESWLDLLSIRSRVQ